MKRPAAGISPLRATSPLLVAWLLLSPVGSGPAALPDTGTSAGATSSVRDDIARLLKEGRYSAAEERARTLLPEVEREQGRSSLGTSAVLDLIVEALWRDGRGHIPEARALAERSLAIKEEALGSRDPGLVPGLRNMGAVLEQSGDAKAAKPFYERAIAIQEGAFGPRHPQVTRPLVVLANLYVNTGDDASARPLYERALAIQEETSERDDALVALILHNLALLHYRAGDYPTAQSMFERTLALKENVLGPEHLDVAWTLNALAIVLEDSGDFSGARSKYERALRIRETALGPNHLQVAEVLNNMGILLRKAGDTRAAAACLERALAIQVSVLGPEAPGVAVTRYNLGVVFRQGGDLEAARSQLETAHAIQLKTIGPDRPVVAETLNTLASVLAARGERAQARTLYEEALATWRRTLGPHHPDYTLGLRGLARLELAEGDLDSARTLLEQTLAVQRATLGAEHPDIADSLATLGSILARTGEVGEALADSLQAEAIGRNHLRLTSRALSEREALRYASARPSGLSTALSLAAAGLDPAQRRDVWDALIRSRALVLDEMAARRHLLDLSGDPALARLAADVADASRRLANLSTRGPDFDHPESYRGQLEEARAAKDAAERAVAGRSVAFDRDRARERLGFAEVAARLASGSALLAYVRYAQQPGGAPAYAAFALRGGQSVPWLAALGPAADIDGLVARWRREVSREPGADPRGAGAAEAAARAAGAALRVKIWDPVLPGLGNASRVFVVPDGSLHLVSFAALPTGASRYLVETGPLIHYLSTERGIDVAPIGRERGEGLLALGGVAFDARVTARAGLGGAPGDRDAAGPGTAAARPVFRGERSACLDLQSLQFPALPGTAREVDTIASLWAQPPGRRATAVLLTGPQAGEAAFKALAPGRRVLHLATHGFFLGGRCGPAGGPERGIGGLVTLEPPPPPTSSESPLLLSGLALAGANLRQQAGPDDEDGILTAEEVAAMDLHGVEWAVLSACDTGVGALEAGEGVLGLRRALEVAGVATVIMSLWPVDDESALPWMRALYAGRLVRRLGTAEALREADRTLLKKDREETGNGHPFHWAAFVAAGDWR